MAKEMATLNMQGIEYKRVSPLLESDTSFALMSPVVKKENNWVLFGFPSGILDLTQLGQVIGLNSEEDLKYLISHEKRLKKYYRASSWFVLAYYFPVAITSLSILVLATNRLFDSTDSMPMLALLFMLYFVVLILMIMIIVITAQRIAAAFLHRSYAETLAFIACLNLIVELSLNDLLLPEARSLIIKRALGLRKFLTLLTYRYAINSSRSIDLARQHYKKMEHYIGDIEHQILISNASTQKKLEQELYAFLNILLTTRYADFKYWKKVTIVEEKVESNTRRIVKGILRTIGALIPLLLFIGLLVYPERFTFLGSYTNLISVVSLTWLLLTIDTLLGVGIIDRVMTLSKAIKDLR